jgi:DNA polymerase delta subunit 1
MLGRFVKVQATCTNCPTRYDDPLCDRCQSRYLEILISKMLEMEEMKAHYQDLWGECQKCQGSYTMDILCSNADCPIYYKRIKVKKDLGKKVKQMARLEQLKPEDLTLKF